MANTNLTPERLKELLHYDEDTGIFTRIKQVGSRGLVGDIAGSLNHGYLQIMVDGEIYLSHRLAWLYVNGVWPKDQIDHIDGTRSNNRILNLREATMSENLQNLRKALSSNKTGLLGASWHKCRSKFQAQIVINRKKHHLGYFDNAQTAHHAYLKAKQKLHPYAPSILEGK